MQMPCERQLPSSLGVPPSTCVKEFVIRLRGTQVLPAAPPEAQIDPPRPRDLAKRSVTLRAQSTLHIRGD